MIDTLETAAACGLSLHPKVAGMPKLTAAPADPVERPFDDLIASWYPLTYALNSLSRGLGVADVYPFVVSAPAVEKLRYVHETVIARTPVTPPTTPAVEVATSLPVGVLSPR